MPAPGIDRVAADVAMDAVGQALPLGAQLARHMRGVRGPPEGDPGHDLGMGEMLRRAADLPDTVVGPAPDLRQVLQP